MKTINQIHRALKAMETIGEIAIVTDPDLTDSRESVSFETSIHLPHQFTFELFNDGESAFYIDGQEVNESVWFATIEEQ